MEKEYLVTKSNYFIMNSSYDLSLEEQKIILTLASMVQPTDVEFKPYTFKINEFIALLGLETQTKYTEIPKITKELMKKVFEIQEGNKIIQTAWLSGAIYEKGTGYVELTFSPYLKPYMLKLKEQFTQYQLANILSMKSKYSPRIYEILKCNEFKKQGYIEVEVEELRKLLKTESIYPRYNDFKRKIIEQAQKELMKNSDISFDFEEIKTGRKVTSLKFIIKSNKKVNAPIDEVGADKQETPLDEIEKDIKLIMNITNNEFSEKTAMLFREVSKGDISLVQKIYDYTTTKNITEGKVGYMRRLFDNFEEPLKSTGVGKTKFNNFEPRNKSARYLYLEEQCLLGQATEEERREFDEMRGAYE